MNFYISSSLMNALQVREYIQLLTDNFSDICTYNWAAPIQPGDRNTLIRREIDGVRSADYLVFLPFPEAKCRGSHIEIGVAIAQVVPIFVLGEYDQTCLFYDLLVFCPTQEKLISEIEAFREIKKIVL